MGLKEWLAGDATDLGAQDRVAELRDGKPLTNSWSGHTIGKAMLSNPGALENFVRTYRVGSEQQAQAIRNAKEISRADSQQSMEKGNAMTNGNDSYDRQTRMLDDLDSQLDALHQYVDRTRESYRNQIRSAASQGFMTDYTDKLEEKFKVFSDFIDELFDSIASSKREIGWERERVRALQFDANRVQ